MSPKLKVQILLWVTVFCIAAHPLALLFTTDGLPSVARYILLAAGAVGTIKLAHTQAIQSLSPVSGDVRPTPPAPPPSVRPPPIVTSTIFIALLLFTLLAPRSSESERVVRASSGCNATPIVSDLTPAGACVAAALESGTINFTNPVQAVLQIAQICVGTTAESIFAILTELLANAPDAGAGIGAAPGSWYANVALVANAASKLHGTYAQMVAAGTGK